MIWRLFHPDAAAALGFVPSFFSEADPRSAAEQLNANYAQGGGCEPIPGVRIMPSGRLHYPGDPPIRALAETKLRDEIIRFYEFELLAIIQPDGSFLVTRCD